MKFIVKNLIAICSICILFYCKKDTLTETTLPKLDNYKSTDDLIKQNNTTSTDTFIVNTTTGGNHTTSRGTKITIQPTSFVTTTGNEVKGNVKIEFKEIIKKSDIILNELSTSKFDDKFLDSIVENPLNTESIYYIKVISDSGLVNLKNDRPIIVELDVVKSDTAMVAYNYIDTLSFFTQKISPTDSVYNLPQNYIYKLYSLSQKNNGTTLFSISSNEFKNKSKSLISVSTSNSSIATDARAYFLLKDTKTVCRMYKTSGAYKYANVPQNFAGTIVAFAVKDGKIYSSFTDFNIQNDTQLNINLTESSSSEFLTKLKTLD
ncbi:MAG: hypothetical protein RLZZ175_1686 [Bacteroidota bacterium]|jgi:hypothetical protein